MQPESGTTRFEHLVEDYARRSGIEEYGFLSIARQGGRAALEVLASAAVKQGKHVYVGVNLAGPRAMAPNVQTIRIATTRQIPAGDRPLFPSGLMVMHDSLLEPAREPSIGMEQGRVRSAVASLRRGTLMVCTPKPPQLVAFPLEFEGTVATVDAESIFLSVVGISPPAFGIVALGLLAAAVESLDFLAIEAAALEFLQRFPGRVRETNLRALELAYEGTRTWRNARIEGRQSREEYLTGEGENREEMVGASGGNVAFAWRDSLPVCDQTMCTCLECLAAYYCPEGVVRWENGDYVVDYEFCKGCGVCAHECPRKAIRMVKAEEVLTSTGRISSR